jgi:hypothetical protein
LENNFIIIDYEIVAGNKKKRTQGVTQFWFYCGDELNWDGKK